MGRKRQRRRARQIERQQAVPGSRAPWYADLEPSNEELMAILMEQERFAAPELEPDRCGRCVEFVEDELESRGTCLHPGSGIVAPWTDTPGCDFFRAARRRTFREFRP